VCGDTWFADVAFPATGSYSPLVRLAVARYQSHGLPGLELSTVVRTDFVPLLPDRTCRVEVRAEGAAVRLEARTPTEVVANRVDAVLERKLADGDPQAGQAASLGDGATWVVTAAGEWSRR
jgi:hypothetical protein